MRIDINLASAKIEELEKLKSLIENTIEAQKVEQQKWRDKKMIKTYRDYLIENVNFFISSNLIIEMEEMLHHCIKHFIQCHDKQEWIKENFSLVMENLIIELCYNYKTRCKKRLSEHDTYMLLCEFKTELSKVNVE